jgi:hypothetical protein
VQEARLAQQARQTSEVGAIAAIPVCKAERKHLHAAQRGWAHLREQAAWRLQRAALTRPRGQARMITR